METLTEKRQSWVETTVKDFSLLLCVLQIYQSPTSITDSTAKCPYFPLMTVPPLQTVLQSVLTFHWWLYLHCREYCKVSLLSTDDCTSIADSTANCLYFPLMTVLLQQGDMNICKCWSQCDVFALLDVTQRWLEVTLNDVSGRTVYHEMSSKSTTIQRHVISQKSEDICTAAEAWNLARP